MIGDTLLKQDSKRNKAIFMQLLAAVLWSFNGPLIKLVDLNPIAIAGIRSFIAAIIIFIFMDKSDLRITWNKGLGAIAYASMVILFVSANKLTTSANAILLQFTAPIWVILLSGWFLKEKSKKSDWVTVFIVLSGMVLFFIGDIKTGNTAGNLLAVLSGISMAGMIIFLKLQDEGSPVEMTLLGNVITFIIALPFYHPFPSLKSILGLLIMGVFQLGTAYIFYTQSVKYVSSVEAILITVIEPIFNPPWVFLATGESPSTYAFLGGFVVIITIILRELYEHKKNAAEAKLLNV
jgi:drug/metabolite transporter (DMT)-like permease